MGNSGSKSEKSASPPPTPATTTNGMKEAESVAAFAAESAAQTREAISVPIPRPSGAIAGDGSKHSLATLNVGGTMVHSNKEIQQLIKDHEGLNMSSRKRMELSEQWKFYVFSEPLQRGIDAGFILGSATGALACYWPHNRFPLRLASFWAAGFATGMMGLPIAVAIFDASNEERVRRKENDLYRKQREDFLAELKSK
eukprot:PhM_4_TR16688/c0_g1_i1/m.96497